MQDRISNAEIKLEDLKKNGINNEYIFKLADSAALKQTLLSYLKNELMLDLNNLKNKLANLELSPTENKLFENDNILTNFLRDLIEKRISQFKLILNRSINFYLHFFYKKNQVNIMFPNIRFLLKNHHLWKSQIDHLQKIGFIQVNSNRLQYSLRISNIEDINKIKLLLTKIIYEVFFEDQFRNEHFIEY